jgi:cation:H+ antiporter
MLTGFAFVLAGAVLLYGGAALLVKGASALARSFGIAPAVIGLTVVAFGTSLPELVVTVAASLKGSSGMALGNVVGSNIANIALVLGASACIRALKVEFTLIKREAPMGVGALVLVVLLGMDGSLSRIDGALLLACFLGFIYWSVAVERAAPEDVQDALGRQVAAGDKVKSTLLAVAGLVVVFCGGNLLVDGGLMLAEVFNVPKVIVGLTVIAIGTSLPELATSLVAVTKGEDDIGVGGVLGSNLFNLLGILGVAALITPIGVPATFLKFQYPVLFLFTLGLLPLARSGSGITRLEGAGLLAGYLLYVTALYAFPQFI